MDAALPFLTWAVLVLVALSLLAVVGLGLRRLTYGRAGAFTVGAYVAPLVLCGVLALVVGDLVKAGLLTMLVLLALAVLSLLLTGTRGVFS